LRAFSDKISGSLLNRALDKYRGPAVEGWAAAKVQWGMETMTTSISLGFTHRRCRLQERIDDGTATDQQGRRQQKRNNEKTPVHLPTHPY
jgi:hypothetical protein